MAIAIRSVSSTTTSSDPITLVTSESPSATQVGNVVVVFHVNDFYALSNMPTPTATGSPTLTAITNGTVETTADTAHLKSYTYVVNTGGAQTISVNETGSADEEKGLAAYVLSGVDTTTPIDVAGNTTSESTQPTWVLTAISPSTSDAFLLAHANCGSSGAGGITSPGGGMTERYNTGAILPSMAGASQQLSASGTTGTRTFDPVDDRIFVGLLVAVRTAGGAAAPAKPKSLNYQTAVRRSYNM